MVYLPFREYSAVNCTNPGLRRIGLKAVSSDTYFCQKLPRWEAGHCSSAAPIRHEFHGGLHMSVALPLRIEMRRLIGNADVGLEPVHDRIIPNLVDRGAKRCYVHPVILQDQAGKRQNRLLLCLRRRKEHQHRQFFFYCIELMLDFRGHE